MMKSFSKYLAVALVAMAFASTQLYADSVTCPTNIGFNQPIGDNVTHTTACELGSTNNDSVAQVNADTMFNLNNWQLFGAANGTITGLGDFTGAATSGTLTLNVNWGTVGSLMLVFKDGQDEPDVYVGYLVADGYNGTIDWTTMFKNTRSGGAKDVSHIRAYVIPETSQVPEPASLALLGTGLVSVGGYFRRKLK
jgi:hypothetical protein